MKKMLVTGGTVFVSQRVARYFTDKFDVYVPPSDSKAFFAYIEQNFQEKQ